jgi:hypothetical protein
MSKATYPLKLPASIKAAAARLVSTTVIAGARRPSNDTWNWGSMLPEISAADPLRASGEHPAHRRLRPPPKPRLPSAVRIHLVRGAAAAALRRLALEPPPRRIENARVRLCKRNRQHP